VSNASEREVGKAVAVALGRLVDREFKRKGWLERLVREFEEELRRINSECRVALYSASYGVYRNDFAEVLVHCNKLGSVIVWVYVDFIKYVRVLDAKVE
jgi:hypothetical protein